MNLGPPYMLKGKAEPENRHVECKPWYSCVLTPPHPVFNSDITNPKNTLGGGTAYYYSYDTAQKKFMLRQELQASNVKDLDRLGWSVRLDGDLLLVSSLVR